MTITVIADIVGSRGLDDRRDAQARLDATLARVEQEIPLATRALTPTVGDEQQGEYPTLAAALASTLLIRLALPEDIDLRFGIGVGPTEIVPAAGGDLAEGPGWWAARVAIEHVHDLQQRRAPRARAWIAASDDQDEVSDAEIRIACAYLLARDEIVGAMSERTRRLTYGRCLGRSQADLAVAEGVTQSAISQALRAGGAAAIVEGFAALVTQPPA